jgi:hypothetical protein
MPPPRRNPGDMTDAEDCARYLLQLATRTDTPDVRKQIDACMEDYRARGGALGELAMAIQAGDFADTTLTTFIRAWLNARPWT